jgi:hypothetical protein
MSGPSAIVVNFTGTEILVWRDCVNSNNKWSIVLMLELLGRGIGAVYGATGGACGAIGIAYGADIARALARSKRLLFASSSVFVLLGTVCLYSYFHKTETERQFEAIKVGMTRQEVEAILGVSDKVEVSTIFGEVHHWSTKKQIIAVVFSEGHVYEKRLVPSTRRFENNLLDVIANRSLF